MTSRHEYSFEKLRVWQGARELAKTVYASKRAKFRILRVSS